MCMQNIRGSELPKELQKSHEEKGVGSELN